MSRHKLVKALDLNEEVDDFEGDPESDHGEEVGPEDKGVYSFPLVTEISTRVFTCNCRLTRRL